MYSIRRATTVLLSCLLILTGVPLAAAAPATSPVEIVAEGFESPYPSSDITLGSTYVTVPASTAWWGRMSPPSGRAATGSYGLWCAGSVPARWATYPKYSHGLAILDIPEMADFYSADLSFAYTQPTLGYHDTNSFLMAWYATASSGDKDTRIGFAKTAVNSWVTQTYDLTSVLSDANLSRVASEVMFQWMDVAEYPIGANSDGTPIYPTVKQGEGPTIDDIVISGYKYGPVRNLASAITVSGVELAWDAPYRATGSTTVDDRTFVYRVWAAPDDGAPYSWTELTTDTGTASTTITHTSAAPGEMYRYLVQAWDVDTASPRMWGEPAETTGRLLSLELDCVIDTGGVTILRNGDDVTLTYTVTNTGETGLTDVELRDGSNTLLGEWATLAIDEEKVYVVTKSPTADVTYEANATSSEGTTSNNSVSIDVRNPALHLDIMPTHTEVAEGASADVNYTITNTGDTDLTDVQVVNSSAQVLFSGLSLAEDEDVTLVRAVPVTEDVTLSAKAVGTYGAAATTFHGDVDSATDSASIVVVESRIYGPDRFETAASLSQATFDGQLGGERAVVIASGRGWADALPASALAGAVNGPLLLSDTSVVPEVILDEIDRLSATKAYIVGGTAVLTSAIETQLRAAGITSIERFAGQNRYDTSRMVALSVAAKTDVDTVFVATGLNFPDALAASSIAAALPAPILLTRPDSLPNETAIALESIRPDQVVLCGGTVAVGSAVEGLLAAPAYGSPAVVRKDGAGRYDTALAIIRYGKTLTGVNAPTGIYVATGTNYPDALSGGVLAGIGAEAWRPLMLVHPTDAQNRSPQIETFMDENPSLGFATILGGTAAISEDVRMYVLSQL